MPVSTRRSSAAGGTLWSWRAEQQRVESHAKRHAQVPTPLDHRHVSALTPAFIRILRREKATSGEDAVHKLADPSVVGNLSIVQSRALTGRQIDGINKRKHEHLLGTKWLMSSQECWYRPKRPDVARAHVARAHVATRADETETGALLNVSSAPTHRTKPLDIALLMVDNRPPMGYEVPSTTLRSPDSWGRRSLLDERWRPRGSDRARPGAFQFALIINHIYAQLHGYTFYLENPCPDPHTGVDAATWQLAISAKQLRSKPFSASLERYLAREAVCPPLDASHRLGPFPPRAPPWVKLAAIRYTLRRHEYVAYLDSDVHVTEVWQPLSPLLEIVGLGGGRSTQIHLEPHSSPPPHFKWLAAAEEFPPQKLRRDGRAGLANSGILLLAGAPVAGGAMLRAIEEWIWPDEGHPVWMFRWPYEQNALSNVFFRKYPSRYSLLKPGCPINSPFGAFLRHMVGGTPSRKVYHPDHRAAWMLDALRCTLRGVSALTILDSAHSADMSLTHSSHFYLSLSLSLSSDSVAFLLQLRGVSRDEKEPNRRAPLERCAPNEPSLHLNATGCDETTIQKETAPIEPTVAARVRAADWQSCCAFCTEAAECYAWSYAWRWPAPLINCFLLSALQGTVRGRRDYVFSYKREDIIAHSTRAAPHREVWSYDVPRPLFAPSTEAAAIWQARSSDSMHHDLQHHTRSAQRASRRS